jgi:hypothetical protein
MTVWLGVFASGSRDGQAQDASPPAQFIDFERDIRPILSTRCLKCHGSTEPEGELSLTGRERAVAAGVIVPGDAHASSLLERVTSVDADIRMPPDGEPLTDAEVASLRHWIQSGADWPTHWAYRPLERPTIPVVPDAALRDWCRTPIDRFVAARLETAGIAPSAEADRRTLLRRASFDLRGIPPSIKEIREFLADDSPHAWEQAVDRLLASPAYGERWARHWMDLVHFAETHGHDQDRPRDNAWPYRDYLIRALNADIPYARFVSEQIAGDVLAPHDPAAITATGFLAAGPWDESSLRDIQEASIDREIGRYLDRDDIVTTVMSTFTSTSVHCARCHDHKFDPISQADYYGLQAVFSGIDKANRPFDDDPTTADRRTRLQAEKTNLDLAYQQSPQSLVTPESLAALAAWESDLEVPVVSWQPLASTLTDSQGGGLLKPLEDQSFLAEGARPDKAVYVVEGTLSLAAISALRLEVLTDDSLPMKGPGRQDNGNLHLNEVRVFQVLSDSSGRALRELRFGTPQADFNQEGWTIASAIDGNPNTGWGIYPAVGESHQAVLPLSEPATSADAITLRVELHQLHGGGHLIGRFRISATDAPADQLGEALALPIDITTLLGIDPSARTVAQQARIVYWLQSDTLAQQIAALPPQRFVYSGTNQFAPDGSFRPTLTPRTIQVLHRGLVSDPRGEAQPRSLACLPGLPGELSVENAQPEGERRRALAAWLADSRNVLVWRSIVNRVWQWHFGRGLVESSSDFGQMGASPSHSELLDWLAAELQASGGSLKHLHRLILTSAVYRQQSQDRPDASVLDTDNRLLWRMNRQRLDAESFRDALLVVSDTLDDRMGGPSDRHFVETTGVHVTLEIDYQKFDVNSPANHRRSIYRFLFRTIPDPLMESLDCPDASQLSPTRTVSLTALQALATLNDKFVVRQSELLADVLEQSSPDRQVQISEAYRRLLGRDPTAEELSLVADYADHHGLPNACRFLLNANEFWFVD